MRKYFRIGKIISLHGIKGEVKIFPTTDDIKRFDDLKEFYILNSDDANDDEFNDLEPFLSEGVKYIKNTCILKIKNYNKIEESNILIGKNIYVKREDAVPLNSDEYYIMDLIGIKTYLEKEYIGPVKDIMKSKYYSILVIDYKNKDLLVPMVKDYILNVDIEKSIINFKTLEGLT
jgi:16S rRNA processing protein RimM